MRFSLQPRLHTNPKLRYTYITVRKITFVWTLRQRKCHLHEYLPLQHLLVYVQCVRESHDFYSRAAVRPATLLSFSCCSLQHAIYNCEVAYVSN